MDTFAVARDRRVQAWKLAPSRALVATLLVLILGLAVSLIAGPAVSQAEAGTARAQGKLYGFGGISQTGPIGPTAAAALIAGVGGNSSRTTLHWQALEPDRNVYDEGRFARYETLYAGLRAAGIKPIFVLQFAPRWARDEGAPQDCGAYDSCHYPPAASMLGEWREFVAEIARRFPDAAIEVWNEPNYAGQWHSGVDPIRYAQLLAEADEAAAAVDPQIPVYMGGLGTAQKPNSLAASDFLNKAYSASTSIKGHTDAINFHIYPGLDLGGGSMFANVFANLRAVRAAHGDGNTPLLVTEVGATTTGPAGLTESQQADLLLRVTNEILSMPDALGVLVYSLADKTTLPATDPERGFGAVVSVDLLNLFHAKPAYCALLGAANLSVPALTGLSLLTCPDSAPSTTTQPRPTATNPASRANQNHPRIIGEAEPGSTVRLFTDAACSGPEVARGVAAEFADPGIEVEVGDDTESSFWATATDQAGNTSACSSSSVTYSEDSTPVNPVAIADTFTIAQGAGPTALAVRKNDQSPSGVSAKVLATTNAAHGSVAITNSGADLRYTPEPGYCSGAPAAAPDSFTYTLNGGSSATVSVIVRCNPVAIADTFTIAQGAGPTALAVRKNDQSPSGVSAKVLATTNAAHGSVAITNSGADLRYTPEPGYCSGAPAAAPDSFTYTLNGGSSATVSVIVRCNPVAIADTFTIAQGAGPTALAVRKNDQSPSGVSAKVLATTNAAHGSVAITNSGADLRYTPEPGYCSGAPAAAPDSFTYTLNGGSSATVSVIVRCR